MKKRRIEKFTAVILALLLLVSCSPKSTNGANSTLGENETHDNVIANQQTNTETNEKTEIRENEMLASSQPEKEETTSRLPVERPDGTKQEVHTSSIPSEEVSSEQSAPETTAENDPAKRKYIMPPDNPAPIEVNRENAHIPVPISFTSALQDGEAVEYKMTNTHYGSGVDSIDRYISIINSYDELVKPFDVAKGEYDEAFFEKSSLIALYLIEGTYKTQHEVKSVTQKDGQMCIHVKRGRVGEGYAATYARVFIQISKEDLKNTKNIVVYEEKTGTRLLRRDPHVEV